MTVEEPEEVEAALSADAATVLKAWRVMVETASEDSVVTPGPVWIAESAHGVQVIRRTFVGPRGKPILSIDQDLRWLGPAEWEHPSRGGCVVRTAICNRRSIEAVAVAAGRFEALRFESRVEGWSFVNRYWLAAGIGVVRHVVEDVDEDKSSGDSETHELVEHTIRE